MRVNINCCGTDAKLIFCCHKNKTHMTSRLILRGRRLSGLGSRLCLQTGGIGSRVPRYPQVPQNGGQANTETPVFRLAGGILKGHDSHHHWRTVPESEDPMGELMTEGEQATENQQQGQPQNEQEAPPPGSVRNKTGDGCQIVVLQVSGETSQEFPRWRE